MPFKDFDLIPLHVNQKRPFGDDWRTREWSADELEFYESMGHNFGVRLRKIDLIVDFDIKHLDAGVDPEMFVFEFMVEFGILGALTVRTASGGYHVYLKKDPNLQIKRYLKEYGQAIEFKTFGTQVVAPGSKVDGREYVIETDGPQMQVPHELAEAIRKETDSENSGQEILPLEKIKTLLDRLPPEECREYDTWLKIGQAIHSGTDGSDEGRELFVDWSTNDPEYLGAGDEIRKKWDSFTAGGSINVHYIKKVMKDLGIEIPRPTAADDFADIPIDFDPEIDRPVRPEFVSNYRLVGGEGLSEEEKLNILNKHMEKLEETEQDFQSRIGGMTEKQQQKAMATRQGKINRLIAKAEAEIEKENKKALVPIVEPLSPKEIFEQMSAALQSHEWGVYGEKVAILSDDKERVNRFTPESLVNILDTVGVAQRWKGMSSSGDYLVSRKDFAKYIVENRSHGKVIDSITDIPSWPMRSDTIYYGVARKWVNEEPRVRGKLDEFIDFFKVSGINRKLAKAYFLTLLWGTPGKKPGFAILSSAKALKDKKTTGKSRFVQYMNLMASGMQPVKLVHQGNNVEAFSRQVANLTLSAQRRPNLFMLENYDERSVPMHEFNEWAEAEKITGRAIREATAEITNDFTFVMTSNAPALTADLADRFIPIYLDRPTEDPREWEDRIERFIAENREQVVKEALELLKAEKTSHVRFCRFSTWQAQILGNIVSEIEWQGMKDEISDYKDQSHKELNRDIQIFEDFDDFIVETLEKVAEGPESFSKMGVKKSWVKSVSKMFVQRIGEKGITSSYIMENLGTYSKLLMTLEKITRGPSTIKTSSAAFIVKGTGSGYKYLKMTAITPDAFKHRSFNTIELDEDYFG